MVARIMLELVNWHDFMFLLPPGESDSSGCVAVVGSPWNRCAKSWKRLNRQFLAVLPVSTNGGSPTDFNTRPGPPYHLNPPRNVPQVRSLPIFTILTLSLSRANPSLVPFFLPSNQSLSLSTLKSPLKLCLTVSLSLVLPFLDPYFVPSLFFFSAHSSTPRPTTTIFVW